MHIRLDIAPRLSHAAGDLGVMHSTIPAPAADRLPQCRSRLRRSSRARQALARSASRRNRLRRRPFRLRQDDGAEGRGRPDRADARRGRRSPARRSTVRAATSRSCSRIIRKALLPWRTADRQRLARAGGDGNCRVRRAPSASRVARARRPAAPMPTNIPRKCRAACSSACRSRAASRRSPPR